MKKVYCGICQGERGCPDCKKTIQPAVYTGLSEFVLNEAARAEKAADSGAKRYAAPKEYLLAADIGTTTLAFVCTNEAGEVLASYGCENPQRKTAADVIGRIDAAMHGEREKLKTEIREALAKGFLFVLEKGMQLWEETESERKAPVVRIALAGNTTMQHLFLDYPTDGMAKAPFVPYSLVGETKAFSTLFSETSVYERFPEAVRKNEITVLPCFSAFVGGDVTAGMYALFPDALRADKREKQPSPVRLLLDLGTNGELLLYANGVVYGTAAAMGCAFEGGRFAYAADLIHLIAEALEQKAIEETGLLAESYFSKGFHGLFQEDIREFQLAKGALCAGIELLYAKAGLSYAETEKVFLAGGIGRFCRSEDLFLAELLPQEFIGKTEFVGNSCIGGLISYLKNRETMLHCNGVMLNLAQMPEFEEAYYRHMDFGDEKETVGFGKGDETDEE